jgi:hypothetical protein
VRNKAKSFVFQKHGTQGFVFQHPCECIFGSGGTSCESIWKTTEALAEVTFLKNFLQASSYGGEGANVIVRSYLPYTACRYGYCEAVLSVSALQLTPLYLNSLVLDF